MNKLKFSLSNYFTQIKADLIGKDSYRGVTLTYSWLANQFGHISLGFMPTIILFYFRKYINNSPISSFKCAFYVATAWTLFETCNFLVPLLFKKEPYVFKPSWFNVAFDTITDILFFTLGSFLAGRLCDKNSVDGIIPFIVFLVLLYPIAYWFTTKMLLQYARFPLQLRLSQWKKTITTPNQKIVLSFLENSKEKNGHHLLIFGGDKTGKSTLGIGLATDFAINRHSCSYYTCIKWLSTIMQNDDEIKTSERNEVWSWRNANCLIIDDINPSEKVDNFYLTPSVLFNLISRNKNNLTDLAQKNVIWIVGFADDTLESIESWKSMVMKLGVEEKQILIVHL